jgi:hypothetical protein
MEKIMQILGIAFMCVFQGCSGSGVTHEEIIGVWIAEDGGEFLFNGDGTFAARNLPGRKVFKIEKYKEKIFSESGTWKIVNTSGKQWTEIALEFDNSDSLEGGFSGLKLNISGTGIFENKPPWNLFLWIDEAGGDRYTFRRK